MTRTLPRRTVTLGLLLAGCTAPSPPPLPAEPRTDTIHLVIRGWHTEIALTSAQARGRLAPVAASFPAARTFSFGFGQRDYMQQAQPGLGDELGALLPGPGAMVVSALPDAPATAFAPADRIALRVSAAGLARLDDFIAGSFGWADGAPRRIAAGPYADSVLYASPRAYSAGYTCNTWTAEALQAAGLPIDPSGVVFADDMIAQARRIAATQ